MWAQIARWFVTLAPGYFFNDIATAAGNALGIQKTSDGKWPWWFPLAIIAAIALVIVFIVAPMFRRGKSKGGLFVIAILSLCVGLDLLLGINPFASLAVALITLTTGVGVLSTANSTYLPRYFAYVSATQLTGVKISYQGGGVIMDLDAAGLNALRAPRLSGAVTNGTYITLTNGLIINKNIIWEFTNSAAQTPTVYVGARERAGVKGPAMILTATKAAVLANSGTEFDDFAFLGLPSLAATDTVNVSFRDGTVQLFNRADLQFMLQETQNQVNTPDYSIDNFAKDVKRVTVTATAAFTAYVQKWQKVGQMVEAQLQ